MKTSLNLYRQTDIAYFDFFLTTFGMDDDYGTLTKSVKIQEGYETDTSFGLQFNSGNYNFSQQNNRLCFDDMIFQNLRGCLISILIK